MAKRKPAFLEENTRPSMDFSATELLTIVSVRGAQVSAMVTICGIEYRMCSNDYGSEYLHTPALANKEPVSA